MRTKTSKLQSKKQINWALPNQTVTQQEFMESIKESEESSFITVEEFDQRFETWKHKKGL